MTIDHFEPIEFLHKDNLVIDAGAGSDRISLNNSNTPTGLTEITVHGGDPTAGSDTVILSGTIAADTINFAPTTDDDAMVTGAGPVPITLATVESTVIDGQGGGDSLTFAGMGGGHITHTPAEAPDAGEFRGDSLMPLHYVGLGVSGSVTASSPGGGDLLRVHGTETNDVMEVAATTGTITHSISSTEARLPIRTDNITSLVIDLLDGDDTLSIGGDHPYSNFVRVSGGSPSGSSDVLNFVGGGDAVTVDLGARRINELGFGPVDHSGFGFTNVDAATGDVTVLGTAGDDTTMVVPLGASAAMVVNNGAKPMTLVSNVGRLLVDQSTGDDVLQVRYTTAAETIDVAVGDGVISDGTLETVNFDVTTTEAVEVYGEQGDDTFNVTPDANIPVFVDGGDPIGSSAGDFIIVDAGGNAVTVEPGPENDAGGILVATREGISFDRIEDIRINNADKALVLGTNADDDVTVIARDSSSHVGTDGVQDFTVSVNDGLTFLYADVDVLYIDAMAGDDDVVVRAPAPNQAFWNVQVFVAGGPPSDGADNEGDRLVFETPGNDNMIYTPTGSETGTVVVDEDGDDVYTPATDTLITMGGFSFVCPGISYDAQGGIELFEYDGEEDDDTVTVSGDGVAPFRGADFTHTVVDGVLDEGAFQVNNFLPIRYQNVGAGARLVVDGADDENNHTFDFFGTSIADVFLIFADAGPDDNEVRHNLSLSVFTRDIDEFSLFGLDGDDAFTIDANTVNPDAAGDQQQVTFFVEGGNPSDSDTVQVNSDSGVNENFTVSHGGTIGSGSVTVFDTGAAFVTDIVNYIGTELVFVRGDSADTDNLIVNGTEAVDDIHVAKGPGGGDLIRGNFQTPVRAIGRFADVTIDISQVGDDTVTFDMTTLTAAEKQYTVVATPGDVEQMVLIGSDAADTVSMPNGTSITFDQGGNADTVSFTTDQLDLVKIQTLAGDDLVRFTDLGVASVVHAGDGDDDVDLVRLTANSTVEGGNGDDDINGSLTTADTVQLTLFGQGGNDNLVGAEQGAAPNANPGDFLSGGPGDDRLEGGRGQDQFFGEAGSDLFVWIAGDGSDLMEGGAGEADELQFIANDSANRLELFGGGLFGASGNPAPNVFVPGTLENSVRAVFALNSTGQDAAQVFLNMGDVEFVNVDALSGADTVNLNNQVSPATFTPTADPLQVGTDLAHTSLRAVDVNLGDDVDDDVVEVHGRLVEDNIDATLQFGSVDIAGFDYGVRIQIADAFRPLDRAWAFGRRRHQSTRSRRGND